VFISPDTSHYSHHLDYCQCICCEALLGSYSCSINIGDKPLKPQFTFFMKLHPPKKEGVISSPLCPMIHDVPVLQQQMDNQPVRIKKENPDERIDHGRSFC
jgi:hypothetical protein